MTDIPEWDGETLICPECGSIGNADDLAYLDEPCPRSWYEDDDCAGTMRKYFVTTLGPRCRRCW